MVAVTDGRTVRARPPVPAGRRPVAARDTGGHLRRRRASRPSDTARRELAEEVGYEADAARPPDPDRHHPGLLRRVSPTSTWPPGSDSVPTDRQGAEERFMEVVEVPLDRFDALVDDGDDRRRHHHPRRRPGPTPPGRRRAERRPVPEPLSPAAEEYLSWLAVEKGRSRNTLLAYRRDLASFEQWAAAHGVDPVAARPRGPSSAIWPTCGPQGRHPGVAGPGHHRPARPLPVLGGGGDRGRRSDGRRAVPEAAPAAAQGPRRGPGRPSDRVGRRGRAGRPAGPGPARGPLRHRGPDHRRWWGCH